MDYDPINWYQRPRSTLGEVRCAPVDPSLPPPWKEVFDVATGRFYYWNTVTNVTQFDKPTYPTPFQSSYPFPYPDPVTSVPPSSALFEQPLLPSHFSPPSLPTSHQTQPLALPIPVVHDLLNQLAAIQQTITEFSNTRDEALRRFQEHRRQFQELRSQWPCRATPPTVTSSAYSVHSNPHPSSPDVHNDVNLPFTHPHPTPQHHSSIPPAPHHTETNSLPRKPLKGFRHRVVMAATRRVVKKTRKPALLCGVAKYSRRKMNRIHGLWVVKAITSFSPEFNEEFCPLSMGPTAMDDTTPPTATNPSLPPIFNVSAKHEVHLSVAVAEEASFTSPECERDDADVPNGTSHCVAFTGTSALSPELSSLNAALSTLPRIEGAYSRSVDTPMSDDIAPLEYRPPSVVLIAGSLPPSSLDSVALADKIAPEMAMHGFSVVSLNRWYDKNVELFMGLREILTINGAIQSVAVYSLDFGIQPMNADARLRKKTGSLTFVSLDSIVLVAKHAIVEEPYVLSVVNLDWTHWRYDETLELFVLLRPFLSNGAQTSVVGYPSYVRFELKKADESHGPARIFGAKIGRGDYGMVLGFPGKVGSAPVAYVISKIYTAALVGSAIDTSTHRGLALDGIWDDSGGLKTITVTVTTLCQPKLVLKDFELLVAANHMLEDHEKSATVNCCIQLLFAEVIFLNSSLKAPMRCPSLVDSFVTLTVSMLEFSNHASTPKTIDFVHQFILGPFGVSNLMATYEVANLHASLPHWRVASLHKATSCHKEYFDYDLHIDNLIASQRVNAQNLFVHMQIATPALHYSGITLPLLNVDIVTVVPSVIPAWEFHFAHLGPPLPKSGHFAQILLTGALLGVCRIFGKVKLVDLVAAHLSQLHVILYHILLSLSPYIADIAYNDHDIAICEHPTSSKTWKFVSWTISSLLSAYLGSGKLSETETASITYQAVGVLANLRHSFPRITKYVLFAGALQLADLPSSPCSGCQSNSALLLVTTPNEPLSKQMFSFGASAASLESHLLVVDKMEIVLGLLGGVQLPFDRLIMILKSADLVKTATAGEFLITSGPTHIQVHALTALPLKFDRTGTPHYFAFIQKLRGANRRVILNAECGKLLMALNHVLALLPILVPTPVFELATASICCLTYLQLGDYCQTPPTPAGTDQFLHAWGKRTHDLSLFVELLQFERCYMPVVKFTSTSQFLGTVKQDDIFSSTWINKAQMAWSEFVREFQESSDKVVSLTNSLARVFHNKLMCLFEFVPYVPGVLLVGAISVVVVYKQRISSFGLLTIIPGSIYTILECSRVVVPKMIAVIPKVMPLTDSGVKEVLASNPCLVEVVALCSSCQTELINQPGRFYVEGFDDFLQLHSKSSCLSFQVNVEDQCKSEYADDSNLQLVEHVSGKRNSDDWGLPMRFNCTLIAAFGWLGQTKVISFACSLRHMLFLLTGCCSSLLVLLPRLLVTLKILELLHLQFQCFLQGLRTCLFKGGGLLGSLLFGLLICTSPVDLLEPISSKPI